MKLFLSSVLHDYCNEVIDDIDTYILESFYNIEKRFSPHYHKPKELLIDSGIFYYNNNRKHTNFNSYCSKYADFLVAEKIDKYFEMDVDSLESLSHAEKYRARLERTTGKPCIPVWHISRGIDYYKGLCRDYDYIAIGSMSTKELKTKDYGKLIPLIDYAHSQGTRVHGLGFTALRWLPRLKFDTVDSSSWSVGRRYGVVWEFDRYIGEMRQCRQGYKDYDWRKVTRHNYTQWRRYQKYVYSNF